MIPFSTLFLQCKTPTLTCQIAKVVIDVCAYRTKIAAFISILDFQKLLDGMNKERFKDVRNQRSCLVHMHATRFIIDNNNIRYY